MLKTQRGNVSVEGYAIQGPSGEVCVTHRGDMSEKGIQFLVGVEDAVLSEIIGSRYLPRSANHLGIANAQPANLHVAERSCQAALMRAELR